MLTENDFAPNIINDKYINWQPISYLIVLEKIIDEKLKNTKDLIELCSLARFHTNVLEYYTIREIMTLMGEKKAALGLIHEQFKKWHTTPIMSDQKIKLYHLKDQIVTIEVSYDELFDICSELINSCNYYHKNTEVLNYINDPIY